MAGTMPGMVERQITAAQAEPFIKRYFPNRTNSAARVLSLRPTELERFKMGNVQAVENRFVLRQHVPRFYRPLVQSFKGSPFVYVWLEHNAATSPYALMTMDYSGILDNQLSMFFILIDAIWTGNINVPRVNERLAATNQISTRLMKMSLQLISGCVNDPTFTNEQRAELRRVLNLTTDEQTCASLDLDHRNPNERLTDYINRLHPSVAIVDQKSKARSRIRQPTNSERLRLSEEAALRRARARRAEQNVSAAAPPARIAVQSVQIPARTGGSGKRKQTHKTAHKKHKSRNHH
jgi:hypothetical protein